MRTVASDRPLPGSGGGSCPQPGSGGGSRPLPGCGGGGGRHGGNGGWAGSDGGEAADLATAMTTTTRTTTWRTAAATLGLGFFFGFFFRFFIFTCGQHNHRVWVRHPHAKIAIFAGTSLQTGGRSARENHFRPHGKFVIGLVLTPPCRRSPMQINTSADESNADWYWYRFEGKT